MSLLHKAYPLTRAALFSMDAEKAHEFTLETLKKTYNCPASRFLIKQADLNKPTKVMGLTVKNPIGLAAGLDKNGAYIDALASLGFGFMEVGTVTPRAQPGNPKPRMFRLPKSRCLINRMGFNNNGLDAFIDNVKQSQWHKNGGILGLNIGKNAATAIENSIDDYLAGLEGVYEFASYITINISSPNTKNLRSLQSHDSLGSLLAAIKNKRDELADKLSVYKPIAVKIAPDLSNEEIDAIANLIPEYEIDGVVATNTTISRHAVSGQAHANEAGGLSGPPVHEASLNVIARLRSRLGPQIGIIGVGGIESGQQAQEKIAAGANTVQIFTGLIYQGPGLIKDCFEALQ